MKFLKNNLLQDKDFIDKLKNYDKDLNYNAHINDSINLIGRNRQDKGEITPYFSAYRVIIPKEEKDKILKGNK